MASVGSGLLTGDWTTTRQGLDGRTRLGGGRGVVLATGGSWGAGARRRESRVMEKEWRRREREREREKEREKGEQGSRSRSSQS